MSLTTAANNTFYSADAQTSSTLITWWGIQESSFDGYEYNGRPDEWRQFAVETAGWPNRIEWGNDHHSWVKVHINQDSQSTTNDVKTYYFYYRWTGNYPTSWPNYQHIDELTVNFSPIVEEQEVAPETFLKWLERLGHDHAFVRMQHRMQKRVMRDTGQLPPWDPRKIEQLEQERIRLQERFRLLDPEEAEKERAGRLKERWGIEEIPPLTPELLDQIAENSLNFLKECLSPDELKFFDEHGHCKIRSPREPQVYYIIKATEQERVERYEKDELTELICIHSAWGGLPIYDTLAAKVLHIKCAEDTFLDEGNRTKVKKKEPELFF